MPTGNCFNCREPDHWSRDCPLKTPTKTNAVAISPPPVIQCPYDGGPCDILTSKTEKNPNRRFYKCSASPSCKFFKWCDQVSIESKPVTVHPSCPCGSGPCRRVTVIHGPNAHRSYFVCCIKKWEDDAQIQYEPEEAVHGGSPRSTLIGFSGFDSVDDEKLPPETDFNGIDQPVGKKPIPVCFRFNNLESNQGIAPSFDLITAYKDEVSLETEEQVLPQLDALGSDQPTNGALSELNRKESCASEVIKASRGLGGAVCLSQNINSPFSNGTNKPEHVSTTSGETEDAFSGRSSLMDLIEKYNSEKFHFESVSAKHVDALTAFTGSYKRLESFRETAHSLRKQLVEVEKQVKLYEAETSACATSLQEVSGEMVKSQTKMVETAEKVAKEVRVCQGILQLRSEEEEA